MTEFKFLFAYVFFLFFMIFLISLGAPSIVENEGLEINPPVMLEPTGNIFEDLGLTFGWFGSSIVFFIQLTQTNSAFSYITTLILTPGLLLLLYIFITKIAIPFLEAIGSLIPFT